MNQEDKKIKKLKFDDIEYNSEDLPEEAKNLINGLKTVNLQLKMYGDTINLLNVSKKFHAARNENYTQRYTSYRLKL